MSANHMLTGLQGLNIRPDNFVAFYAIIHVVVTMLFENIYNFISNIMDPSRHNLITENGR